MKSLNRIISTVYNTPWLIRSTELDNYSRQLNAILEGKIEVPTKAHKVDSDNEAVINTSLDTQLIYNDVQYIEIVGTVGKGVSQMDIECGGVCDILTVQDQLLSVLDNPSIKTLGIYFDTPGGTVTQVPETAEIIRELSKKINVVGYSDGLCCSAGYWLASQCNQFYCSPSSIIGSVGCYTLYLDETKAMEIEGIKVNAFKSGKYKLTGASFLVMTDEEKKLIQAESDELGAQFRQVVKSTRSILDDNLEAQCFSGATTTLNGYSDGNLNTTHDWYKLLNQDQ